jgi:hypothetical protein
LSRHGDDGGRDLALVFLDRAVLPSNISNPVVMPPRIVRPSFNPGARGGDDSFDEVVGAAGFSPLTKAGEKRLNVRQIHYMNAADEIELVGSGNGTIWRLFADGTFGGGVDWGTYGGDSGSPLFAVRGNDAAADYRQKRHRDPFGILSGKLSANIAEGWNCYHNGDVFEPGTCIIWTDITQQQNRDWILGHVRNRDVPDALHPSGRWDKWLAQHGKTLDDWWGEADYSGPCTPDVDLDCDGWWDRGPVIHDNCPLIANPEQDPAVCAPCPWDPAGDVDGDGVCVHGAPSVVGYHSDNCPTAWNADQTNSNEEAEDAERTRDPKVLPLGDACEPVPTPRAIPQFVDVRGNLPPGSIPPDGRVHGRFIQNRIDTVRLPSHSISDARRGARVFGVETSVRFCQNTDDDPDFCRRPDALREAMLTTDASAELEKNDRDHPWHRITTTNETLPRDPRTGLRPPRDRNATFFWDYDDTAVTHEWDYLVDNQFWAERGKISAPPAAYAAICTNVAEVGNGTCLDGRIWYHAKTPIGSSTKYANLVEVGIHGYNLSSHYEDIRPDMAYAYTTPSHGLMQQLEFDIRGRHPDPMDHSVKEALLVRTQPLVREFPGGPAYVLSDDGRVREMRDVFFASPLTQRLIASPLRWISLAEPSILAGNLDRRFRAIGFSVDGTRPVDITMSLADGRMSTYSETLVQDGGYDSPPPPPPIDDSPDVPVYTNSSIGMVASSASSEREPAPGAPEPRRDFIATFSSSLGGAFVLGGTSTSTGAELRDIHFWRLGLGWTTIAAKVDGRIVAAAPAPLERSLWILEEIDDRWRRIVRVSPWTGKTDVLATWPLSRQWNNHFLTVDTNGEVLLVASSKDKHKSVLTRFAKALIGDIRVDKVISTELPYTSDRVIVDTEAYGFVTRNDQSAITGIVRHPVKEGESIPILGTVWSILSSLFN